MRKELVRKVGSLINVSNPAEPPALATQIDTCLSVFLYWK